VPSLPPQYRPAHMRSRRQVTKEREARRTRAREGALENTARWQKMRRLFRADAVNALCVCCKANSLVKAAELVDHIVPHEEDLALCFDQDNLQALCKPCHDTIKRPIEAAWREGKASADDLRLNRLFPEHFG
jgi:5-methylcytosine-specific restriction endonuclease McrA